MAESGLDRDVLLNRLADEFAARYRGGERPALQEYVEKYPDLADDIRELFPAMVEMEQVKEDHREVEPPAAGRLPPLEQLGDFRILREIGHGGMGVVYEAEQISLGRHVALKVLPQKVLLDAKQKRRFEREAKAAAKLHHTNIVPVFGVGEHEGLPYYAMQFIQGLGLDEVIEELRRIQVHSRGPLTGGQKAEEEAEVEEELPLPSGERVGVRGDQPGVSNVGRPFQADPTVAKERRPGKAELLDDSAGNELRDGRNRVAVADVAHSLLTGVFRAGTVSGEYKLGQPIGEFAAPDGNVDGTSAGGQDAEHSRGEFHETPLSGRRSDALSLSSSSVVLPGQSDSSHESGTRKTTYWQSAAHIGAQVADALEYAHKQGVLHRDVKPSNLLLDTRGTVWLTDFGLAKADDQENLTQSGDLLGTLRYMAPEAFDGKSDPRSDVYGLGLTLYELLALRPAFDERDQHRLIKRVTSSEPAALDGLNRAIPRDLVTVVQKAIERDPDQRYATAGELAADLRRFLADEPIQARRTSALEQLRRWARHHPGVAASLAVICLLLVAVTVVSVVAAERFRKERDKAEVARDDASRREAAERWERYRSNIAAATSALQLQNIHTVRRALEAAPEQHRNWEWRYLHNQLDGARVVLRGSRWPWRPIVNPTGKQIAIWHENACDIRLCDVSTGTEDRTLRGHEAPIVTGVYSPDGDRFASVSEDETIRLWDAETGEELAVLRGHETPIAWLVYSPDGRRILSRGEQSEQCAYHLWDTATGNPIAVLAEHAELGDAAFSPDGRRIAISWGRTLFLIDAETGEQVAELGQSENLIEQLMFSPDGRRIASRGASEKAIRLWDGETGKEVAVLSGHTSSISNFAFSPDGTRIVTAGMYADNTARLWDATTGRELAVMTGHKNGIRRVVFSPDGRHIVSSSLDQTGRLWDGVDGRWLATLSGHNDGLWNVAFSPDGKRFVTTSGDQTLRLWDTHTGELIAVLRGHDAATQDAAYSADGSLVVSRSADGELRVWDMELAERNGILRGHEKFVYDVSFSPDGSQAASSAWDGTVRLWDVTTGRQTGLLKHEIPIVSSVAWHPNGKQLASVTRQDRVHLWDLNTGTQRHVFSVRTGSWEGDARAVFNPAGTLLALGNCDGEIHFWDVDTGEPAGVIHGDQGIIRDVAFHPDGGQVAAGGFDGTVRVWDLATRAPLAVLRGHNDFVYTITYSADGRLLASGSHDGTVRLWDAETHGQLAILPHGSRVHGLSFSPDGTRLATACADNTIRLWDVASRQEVCELRGHANYVHAVSFSPDGTRLVSGSGDHTVRVWDTLPPAARAQADLARKRDAVELAPLDEMEHR